MIDAIPISVQAVSIAPNYRLRMAGLMLLADLAGLLLAVLINDWLSMQWSLTGFSFLGLVHGMFLFLSLALFFISKLYPGIGINPATEIKLVFQFTFTALTAGALTGAFIQPLSLKGLQNLLLLWFVSLVLVLGFRWTIRIIAVRMDIWKEPVLIIARGKQAVYLSHYFHKRYRLGFFPAVVATDNKTIQMFEAHYGEMPITIEELPLHSRYFAELGIRTAIVDLSAADIIINGNRQGTLHSISDIIFVSNLGWLEGAKLSLHDFEGILGIEARKKTLSIQQALFKEFLDFSFSLFLLLFHLPMFIVTALLIKIDSAGPVFYMQKRVGKNGKTIRIVKFRTMVQHAEKKLQAYLDSNPEAKAEWNETQKIKCDPRITRVGYWLRKLSIDELPQLINVLKGEMSLVGPRPILPEQIEIYGEQIDLYRGMKPGMTGLWQVSGRNGVSFSERARFDGYYVRNWSIWLDIYILLRTVWVVLFLKDAY